jgi:hypothetical protein
MVPAVMPAPERTGADENVLIPNTVCAELTST